MQEMNSKYNKTKNVSVSNRDRVRAREKSNANTSDLFQALSTKIYVSVFTAWRISLSTKNFPQRNFHKELYGLHKTEVHNSNTKSSTQEVAQSEWG